jgi:hypothetical protein
MPNDPMRNQAGNQPHKPEHKPEKHKSDKGARLGGPKRGPGNGGSGGPRNVNPKRTIVNNFIGGILIFIAIIALYTYTAGSPTPVQKITISDLASDISAGKVTAIAVSADDLTVTYTDKSQKETKKETVRGGDDIF